jgi:hypothetical protein
MRNTVERNGYDYRALEEDWNLAVKGENTQSLFWALPEGFEVAPDDSDTRRVLQTSIVCTRFMVLSDEKAYVTAHPDNSSRGPGSCFSDSYKGNPTFLAQRENCGVLEFRPTRQPFDGASNLSIVRFLPSQIVYLVNLLCFVGSLRCELHICNVEYFEQNTF